MKTTLDLPDELVRQINLRAAEQGQKPEDVIAGLLQVVLNPVPQTSEHSEPLLSRNLPLIKVRSAQPDDLNKLSTQEWCDWLKDLDLQLEVERYEKAFGYQHVDRAND